MACSPESEQWCWCFWSGVLFAFIWRGGSSSYVHYQHSSQSQENGKPSHLHNSNDPQWSFSSSSKHNFNTTCRCRQSWAWLQHLKEYPELHSWPQQHCPCADIVALWGPFPGPRPNIVGSYTGLDMRKWNAATHSLVFAVWTLLEGLCFL